MRIRASVPLSLLAALLAARSAAAQAPPQVAAPAAAPETPAAPPTDAPTPAPLPPEKPAGLPHRRAATVPRPMPAEVSMEMPAIIAEEPPRRGDAWQASIGVRTMLMRDAGYDPFSTDDALVQVALSASRLLTRQDRLALAVGAGFEYGASNATARGASSRLGLLRASLFAEGRYAPDPRFYGFVRVAPGVLNGSASLDDASAPPLTGGTTAPLADSFTLPSLEGSVGAAICLAPASSRVGAWIVAQAGYGWAPSHTLLLAPDINGADRNKVAPLDLGTIAPRGPFLTFALALSY